MRFACWRADAKSNVWHAVPLHAIRTNLVAALGFFDELDYFLGRLLFVGDRHRFFHFLRTHQLDVAIFVIVHLKHNHNFSTLYQNVQSMKGKGVGWGGEKDKSQGEKSRTESQGWQTCANERYIWHGVNLPTMRKKFLKSWSFSNNTKDLETYHNTCILVFYRRIRMFKARKGKASAVGWGGEEGKSTKAKVKAQSKSRLTNVREWKRWHEVKLSTKRKNFLKSWIYLDFEEAVQLGCCWGKSGGPLGAPSPVPKVLWLKLMTFDAGSQRHVAAGTRPVHGAHPVLVVLLWNESRCKPFPLGYNMWSCALLYVQTRT